MSYLSFGVFLCGYRGNQLSRKQAGGFVGLGRGGGGVQGSLARRLIQAPPAYGGDRKQTLHSGRKTVTRTPQTRGSAPPGLRWTRCARVHRYTTLNP